MSLINLVQATLMALARARIPILVIAVTYLVSVSIGIAMAHTGNEFALSYRDALVSNAHANDPSSLALQKGDALQAGLIDFGRNLFLGAIPDTIAGVSVVIPVFLSAHRGWVGGIVSVDANHLTRFANPFQGAYYISVLILQLIPYSLAGGVGVNLGWTYFRPRAEYDGAKWYGISIEAMRDVARVYGLIVPMFLLASLWEFLSPWN